MGRMRWQAAALVMALGVVGPACDAGGEASVNGKVGGDDDFSLALREPGRLHPSASTTLYEGQVLSALFTGLVEYDVETGEPRHAMAESITSPDQQNWTVKIKDGWTFHDGEPVTARSYVDAWNFTAYAPNGNENSYFFANVEGYDALQGDPEATPPVEATVKEMSGLAVVDETTFTVKLTAPFNQFPLTLGYHAFYPQPAVAMSDPKAYEQAPVGNGPFMMDGRWRHDEAIRVKRYADYPGPAAGADAIDFRIFSDDDTSYREFQAGGLDISTSVPLAELEAARRELGDRLVERPSSAFNYLGFNMTDPAFAGKKQLRQAISLAIDRDAIVKAIYNGTRQPARSVIAPVVPGSREDACAYCAYDPKRAQALLAEAGGFAGTLHLWFAAGQDSDEPMKAIANQLRTNLGITDVAFETLPFAELKTKIKNHEVTGPFSFNWLMDYPSAQNYLEPLYTSGSGSNRTGYENPEVDRLIAAGNAAPTFDAAIAKYHAAEDIVLEDMPVIPLWFGKTRAVHSERLENVQIDPFSRIRVAAVRVTG